jgi:hypothetical protein
LAYRFSSLEVILYPEGKAPERVTIGNFVIFSIPPYPSLKQKRAGLKRRKNGKQGF